MPAPLPTMPKRVLTASGSSPMRFMDEEVIYDSEAGSPVRFRGMFEMPNWTGVEASETDHIVDSDWIRLDVLAGQYYKRPELGWVIAARNHIDLPAVQLYKGLRLKIPGEAWVDRKLLTQGH